MPTTTGTPTPTPVLRRLTYNGGTPFFNGTNLIQVSIHEHGYSKLTGGDTSQEKICSQSDLNKAIRRTSWCLSPTVMSSRKTPSSSKPNRLLRLILRMLMSREWM